MNKDSLVGSDKKLQIIANILRNETYGPDSGLCQNLMFVLNRLPINTLEGLALIISLKLDEARDEGRGS